MNFFFGINSNRFCSNLKIPKFQNSGHVENNIKLFSAQPVENRWSITLENKINEVNNFFFVNEDQIQNNKLFFLATFEEYEKNKIFLQEKLISLNSFTNTTPQFRANFKIQPKSKKGFSSYQSDYPLEMAKKKGNILSSISSLYNDDADENYLIFKNIFFEPIIEKFNIYFIDILEKKILSKHEVLTNYTNLIQIPKFKKIKNVFIFSKSFLGIPIYLSIKNNHLSMEHTHPPHHYILSQDKFETIAQVKKEISNIINE